jgi:nucleoside-diphosphate-sugar epimerase
VRVLDWLLHHGDALLSFWARDGFEFVKGDVRDRETVKAALAGCDTVVHLAAIVGDPACARQEDVARSINLDASLQLLELAKEAGIERFIFASTCSNYGKMPDSGGYVYEDSPLAPVSLYAETKVAFEKTLLDPDSTEGLTPTVLRFATVYGASPRMRFDLTVNDFTARLITEGYLPVYGEQFWRPYIHVRDMARGARLALESPAEKVRNEVFNVGDTDENYQKQRIVELIREQVPEGQVEYVQKEEDPRDYRVSFEKIRGRLGFEISRRVPDGVAEVAKLLRDGVITDPKSEKYRN